METNKEESSQKISSGVMGGIWGLLAGWYIATCLAIIGDAFDKINLPEYYKYVVVYGLAVLLIAKGCFDAKEKP